MRETLLDKSSLKRIIGLSILLLGTWPLAAQSSDFTLEPSSRYRYQQVKDISRGDASASTLKLRLTANWQASDNWQAQLQGDYVHAFNDGNFNSGVVAVNTTPINEAKGSEINQVWLRYQSDYNWSLTLGRQALNLDNQRHVSDVAFWQNDQSFDAFTVQYSDSMHWQIRYSYLTKVHRIFGDDARAILSPEDIRFDTNPNRPFLQLGNHQHNSHLLNMQYKFNPAVTVSSYAYLLDNQSASQLSSNTYGIRVTGQIKPQHIKYGYEAEIAHQATASGSRWDFNGLYVLAQVSAQYNSHQFALTHERLSENNGFAFTTSLGNNHFFLGWADVFSGYINADGVRDSYLTYRGRNGKLRWRIMAHIFESDSSGQTAGHELDIELAYRINRDWQASLIYADYHTKGGISGITQSQSDLQSWLISLSYNL